MARLLPSWSIELYNLIITNAQHSELKKYYPSADYLSFAIILKCGGKTPSSSCVSDLQKSLGMGQACSGDLNPRNVGMSLPNLLVAFATFRQKVQPEWFAHIHSHGHAAARLARGFTASCLKTVTKGVLDEIEFSAYMHDIGNYLIRREILLKPGPLDDGEREIISLHPVHGVEILRDLPYITPAVLDTVLHHHERWDGKGYPEGLTGEAIPFAARTVALVDTYTSLRAKRSYRTPLTRSEACEVLRTMAGHELDPNLVHDFLRMIEGHVSMKIAKPSDPDESAYSLLIRETLRAVL